MYPKYSATGNIVKQVEYDTFGNILSDSAMAFAVPFGFAGGLHDRDISLVHFGYRDYDPETGRWTAKDPIGFNGGDVDVYGYTQNDPVNFVDPFGLSSDWTVKSRGHFAPAPCASNQLFTGDDDGLEDSWSPLDLLGGGYAINKSIISAGGLLRQDFFAATKYSDKVLAQMKNADFHAFPESVTAFGKSGIVSAIRGGDGVIRRILRIPGSYRGKEGVFEFIKDTEGIINHRLFRPY